MNKQIDGDSFVQRTNASSKFFIIFFYLSVFLFKESTIFQEERLGVASCFTLSTKCSKNKKCLQRLTYVFFQCEAKKFIAAVALSDCFFVQRQSVCFFKLFSFASSVKRFHFSVAHKSAFCVNFANKKPLASRLHFINSDNVGNNKTKDAVKPDVQEKITKHTFKAESYDEQNSEAKNYNLQRNQLLSFDLHEFIKYPNELLTLLKKRACFDIAVLDVFLKKLIDASNEKKSLKAKVDSLKHTKNLLTKRIEKIIHNQDNTADINFADILKYKKESEETAKMIVVFEEKKKEVEKQFRNLSLQIPNLLHFQVPEGLGKHENEIICEWESSNFPKKVGKGYLTHSKIIKSQNYGNNIVLPEIFGSKFFGFSGQLSKLERVLINFFLDVHTTKHNYTEISLPYLISESSLEGTGQLPKFENELFKLDSRHKKGNEMMYLCPTAEVPLCNIFRNKIIDESQLPLNLTALTACFRNEDISYGMETQGLLRQNMFHKVELVKICQPEASDDLHKDITLHAENILRLLELPYRKIKLCSAETGFSSSITYDLEVWLPGMQKYVEISSSSNCCNFQSKRLNLRYRPYGRIKGKLINPVFCHTINASGLPIGRTIAAIIENYQLQLENNSQVNKVLVEVPKVLRQQMQDQKYLNLN